MIDSQEKPKVILSWSGGKDSALSLFRLQKDYHVVGLLSITNDSNKIPMHNIHIDLINQQALSLGIPLHTICYTGKTSYEEKMLEFLNEQKEKGIQHIAFGDIFLKDVKEYRQSRLREVGMNGLFPLWQESTHETHKLLQEFIDSGFKSIICTFNPKAININILGKTMNMDLFDDLASDFDICGENGEYHSFTYDGPNFKFPIQFKLINHRTEHEMKTCDVVMEH
jgi:uncharacterized protein (TIGR00290 family)